MSTCKAGPSESIAVIPSAPAARQSSTQSSRSGQLGLTLASTGTSVNCLAARTRDTMSAARYDTTSNMSAPARPRSRARASTSWAVCPTLAMTIPSASVSAGNSCLIHWAAGRSAHFSVFNRLPRLMSAMWGVGFTAAARAMVLVTAAAAPASKQRRMPRALHVNGPEETINGLASSIPHRWVLRSAMYPTLYSCSDICCRVFHVTSSFVDFTTA